jgi:signal transduction histidine kinase
LDGARIHQTRDVYIIVGGTLCIGILHHVVPHSAEVWHNVFQWLYYLPVVYAAAHFGLRGGLATALLASLGYIPHFVMALRTPKELANQIAELAVLSIVSAVTGILADREHRRRAELEKTTKALAKANGDLQSSFEQLRRADRLSAIGQLAASLAHEIRNPLASIRGAISVLDDPQIAEDLRLEFRGIINKECSRLERLLTNLLDFARPRSPEYRGVDIGREFEMTIELVGHAAGRSGIRFRKEIASDMPAFDSDPEQLRQVILNLALNAIQAMPNGGEVVLAARRENSNVIIQVRDQGIGVAQDDLDRIFDPFFTTKANGTGLGLSVTHQIIAQHQGILKVDRNPDRGMTFSILIPWKAVAS